MRKIKTQVEIDRGKRSKQIVVGVVMIGLLVVSTLGYSLMSGDSDESSKVQENGFDFFYSDGIWKINLEDQVFGFQYLPSEVSHVETSGIFDLGDYVGKPLYFVNMNDGVSEVLNNIGRYVERWQEACWENSSCSGDLPTKSCDDNLIIFKSGNESSVVKNGSCVYIYGDGVAGADAFLYGVLHI